MTVAAPPATSAPTSKRGAASGDDAHGLPAYLRTSPEVLEITVFAYVLTGLSAIGGFLFGYDTGVVSGAMLLVGKEFNLDTLWHEVIVSGTIASAWLFSLVAGYISDSWGRKRTILVASTGFFVGSIVMGAAYSKEALLVGRIIVGIGVGIASMSVPVYIAECSHADIRGIMVTVYTLGITMGQFIAGLVCGAFSTVDEGWRYMLGLAAVPAGVQFIGLLLMPESPRWLVSRGRIADAEVVVAKLRGKGRSTADEVEAIRKACEEERSGSLLKTTLVKILTTKHTRRALFLGCSLQAIQQLAGINTVMYYSASIIQMAGIGDYSLAIWIAAGVAGMNFICTFIGFFLVDRLGRRPLTLISLAGVVFALILLGVGFLLMDMKSPETNANVVDGVCGTFSTCSSCIGNGACGFCFRPGNASCWPTSNPGFCEAAISKPVSAVTDEAAFTWAPQWCPSDYSWIAITALCLYLVFFAPGMGSTPWTINSEIYPLWARGSSTSIATSCNWLFNLVISLTFLSLTKAITSYGAFFMYAGIAFLGFCLLWVTLPETRGVSLENMVLMFGGKSTDPGPVERDAPHPLPICASETAAAPSGDAANEMTIVCGAELSEIQLERRKDAKV